MGDTSQNSTFQNMVSAIPVVGGLANTLMSIGQNKKNRQFAQHMYDQQRADALADRDFANQYNSPAAQMARFKTAGLNPNLVYGTGASASDSQPVRSSSFSQPDQRAPQTSIGNDILSMIGIIKTQAETDNLRAMHDVIQEKKLTQQAETFQRYAVGGKADIDREIGMQHLDILNSTKDAQIEHYALVNNKLQADTQFTLNQDERNEAMNAQNLSVAVQKIINMRTENMVNQARVSEIKQRVSNLIKSGKMMDFEIQLNNAGFTKGDPAYIRMVNKVVDSAMGIDDDQWHDYN